MSLAVSTVLKVARAAPYSSEQPSATSRARANASSSCSSVVGRGSAATISSLRSSGMHSTGVERPTPRGSKPIRSNRCSTSGGSVRARPIAASAPEAPGPPGLTIREPMRLVCPPITTRMRNSGRLSPPGSS
jgi:hypothetical protein